MKIVIVSPRFKPVRCGIGDHTDLLAAELGKRAEVVVAVGVRDPQPDGRGYRIESPFDWRDARTIESLKDFVIAERPDWLIFQWDASQYYSARQDLGAVRVAREALSALASLRIALVIHELDQQCEPWINLRRSARRAWHGLHQRRLRREMTPLADAIFYPVESWGPRLRLMARRARHVWLPVPSNLPPSPLGRDKARGRLGLMPETITLGLIGRGAPSKSMEAVRAAARATQSNGRSVRILHLGVDDGETRRSLAGIPLLQSGELPADELADWLPAIDVHLAPYAEGVSARRTSLMAGLQQGLAVAALPGAATGKSIRAENGKAILLARDSSPAAFADVVAELVADRGLMTRLGERAREWYQRRFSSEIVVARLLEALDEAGENRVVP